MGNSSSTPSSSSEVSTSSSSCPVQQSQQRVESGGECPVKKFPGEKYKNPYQYNVYGEKIDPKNNMPVKANQEMAPGQNIPLDTTRVKSNIPKGGTEDDTWSYPSPQMFWNSLVRKGKVEGAEEKDMDTVVAIHNNMNENTWAQLLAWEKLHPVMEDGKEPKLLHFMGRPHDLSPKARLKMLFGHPAPFDRHDWVVDRGGQEVRYVIDYYHDESAVGEDKTPESLKDSSSMKSILVDVRPALDSFDSIVDRAVRMPYQQFINNTEYQPPPFLPKANMGTSPPFTKFKSPAKTQDPPLSTFPNLSTTQINEMLTKIESECKSLKEDLASCTTDESCGAAAVALQRCSAMIVCPSIAKQFDVSVKMMNEDKDNDEKTVLEENISRNFNAMTNCMENFAMQCFNAKDDDTARHESNNGKK